MTGNRSFLNTFLMLLLVIWYQTRSEPMMAMIVDNKLRLVDHQKLHTVTREKVSEISNKNDIFQTKTISKHRIRISWSKFA